MAYSEGIEQVSPQGKNTKQRMTTCADWVIMKQDGDIAMKHVTKCKCKLNVWNSYHSILTKKHFPVTTDLQALQVQLCSKVYIPNVESAKCSLF